ncbi:uncharacterized protein LOC142160577 isoform X2 [Mixophyes fleayi]|uniref:uncharacterized protein LOC142160577 isoform X2 n=1 Tax=Mixophyes fleayi TaxID=3061075 RepID=UPI003F4DCC1B
MQSRQAPLPWSPQTAPPMGAFPTVHIPVPQMTLYENIQTPLFHRTFLKGKPEALGGVLIAVGILEIALGIGLVFTFPGISLISGNPFWGGVFYIIAGSLTIPAAYQPSLCLSGGLAINSILVITNLLVFCVAISVAVFGCRSLGHSPQTPAQVFVIQNDFVASPQMHQPISQAPHYANFAQMKHPPEKVLYMASQPNPVNVHFHDTVQINILPSSQHNTEPRWDDPPSAPYWNIPLADIHQNVPPATAERSEPTMFQQVFLHAKPRSRGLFQIFVAHFQLALGIVLIFVGGRNYSWLSYIIFWGPPFYIVSGFLAVAAHTITTCKLVKAAIILHSISVAISFTGLTLCCADVFRIYPCGFSCPFGNMGTLSIISLLLMTNLVQFSMSSYIVVYGFRSLKHYSEDPPQIHAVQNPGIVLPDPPAYSEITANFPQAPDFFQPPDFSQSPAFPEPPAFSQLPAYTQPPAFSQSPDFPEPPAFSQSPAYPQPPAFSQSPDFAQPPAFSELPTFPQPPAFYQSQAFPKTTDISPPPPYSE